MSIAKKEKRAIEYLKAFEPKDEPYYLCYSGGKGTTCGSGGCRSRDPAQRVRDPLYK